MKTKMILFAACVLFASFDINAQAPDLDRVRILQGDKPGIVKILYAIETEAPLFVNIIQDHELLKTDKIKGPFAKGVIRRYDVNEISKQAFEIEIDSERFLLTYKVIPSADRKTFTSYLEKAVYKQPLLAARK